MLVICGNHSCGNLTMVTTDTSSDGFQYLEPALSPDRSLIAFTLDWAALPPPRPPDVIPEVRQIAIIPVQTGDRPQPNLAASGATAVDMMFEGVDLNEEEKGNPGWIDDETLLVWIKRERGNRLFSVDLTQTLNNVSQLYAEPDDDEISGLYWQHADPSISHDKQWVAFTRFGAEVLDSLHTYTQQAIWVLSLADAGSAPTPRAFAVTGEVAHLGSPSWSPDGSRIVFYSTQDIVGEYGTPGYEIFAVDFDTTGLAANGEITLDRNLKQLTHTPGTEGDPLTITNSDPVYTADGSEILFVSTRRAPSITLRDRNIWRIPADGRLDPELLFFSREDDVNPEIILGGGRTLLFSSTMGFPTEMLDLLEQETILRLMSADSTLTETEAGIEAMLERQELEYFAGVMSHLYIFSGW
ncbi:MAG: hypothetical protein ABIF77_07240 [bacterium]